MDAVIIHALAERDSSSSFYLPPSYGHRPTANRSNSLGFETNSWSGQETWCDGGGNTTSAGDPLWTRGSLLESGGTDGKATMGYIDSLQGWASL